MQKKNKPIHDATPTANGGLIMLGEPGGMYEFTPQGVVEERHKKDGPRVNAAKKSKDGKRFPKGMVNKSRTTKGSKR